LKDTSLTALMSTNWLWAAVETAPEDVNLRVKELWLALPSTVNTAPADVAKATSVKAEHVASTICPSVVARVLEAAALMRVSRTETSTMKFRVASGRSAYVKLNAVVCAELVKTTPSPTQLNDTPERLAGTLELM